MVKSLAAALMVILLAALAPASAAQLSLPVPTDLRVEARLVQQKKQPLIVMFSLPGCPYCKVIRQNYLGPMMRDSAKDAQPLIREVDITSNAPLTGFNGEALSQSRFAARYHVKATPTVILMDQTGTALTDPLIGGDTAGFYGAYLDNVISAASKKLAEQAASGK